MCFYLFDEICAYFKDLLDIFYQFLPFPYHVIYQIGIRPPIRIDYLPVKKMRKIRIHSYKLLKDRFISSL